MTVFDINTNVIENDKVLLYNNPIELIKDITLKKIII